MEFVISALSARCYVNTARRSGSMELAINCAFIPSGQGAYGKALGVANGSRNVVSGGGRVVDRR